MSLNKIHKEKAIGYAAELLSTSVPMDTRFPAEAEKLRALVAELLDNQGFYGRRVVDEVLATREPVTLTLIREVIDMVEGPV